MAKGTQTAEAAQSEGMTALRESPTMARLLDALEAGEDIGHYGHFVFTTTARHFLSDAEIADLLAKQPDMSDERARAMVMQIGEKGYSPPKREKILEMQHQQDYPIIKDGTDPDSGNLYRELRFPDDVYDEINHYYEEKAEAVAA